MGKRWRRRNPWRNSERKAWWRPFLELGGGCEVGVDGDFEG